MAALLLDVVDHQDPVQVGAIVTYQVSVKNQGSAPGTGIALSCSLPGEAELVETAGPSGADSGVGEIVFAPLERLDPGAEARWIVVLRCTAPASARFKASMCSDQMGGQPVEETEATTFYE